MARKRSRIAGALSCRCGRVASCRWYKALSDNRLRGVASYEAEREAMLKRFGASLRELREAKFPSQDAFALQAKLHRAHVYMLETGHREPSLSTLLILADALGVSLDRLTQGLAVPRERRPDRGQGGRRRS